jgi:hypothetical protein
MKRTRSDSPDVAIKSAMTAGQKIQPPAHCTLRDGDLPFWESVVSARARDTWTASDLETAANLARCKADIERLQLEINDEGDVVKNDRGTQIINPKHTLLETLSRRSVALARMLHVHAEATVGESRDAPKALKAQRDAEDAMGDDNLIPRLHSVK